MTPTEDFVNSAEKLLEMYGYLWLYVLGIFVFMLVLDLGLVHRRPLEV